MTISEITHYIFVKDADQKGDLAFVFGTWNAWEASIEKAADLYRQGLVPKIIVSGGKNEKTGIVEGDYMAKELNKLGVPAKDVLIENKSTNTLENVLFSRDIIEQEIGLENISTIVAVVKNYHARRSLMTLRKHLPMSIRLKSAPYKSPFYDFTGENWMDTDVGNENVLGEVEKIRTYLAKGDIAEL